MAVTSQVLTPSPSCFSNPLSLISFHVGDNPKGGQPLWFAKDGPGFSNESPASQESPSPRQSGMVDPLNSWPFTLWALIKDL